MSGSHRQTGSGISASRLWLSGGRAWPCWFTDGTNEDYGATQKVPPGAGPCGREGQLRPSVMPALAPVLPDKEASSAGLAGHRAMPPGLFLNLASGQGYTGSQAQSQGCCFSVTCFSLTLRFSTTSTSCPLAH